MKVVSIDMTFFHMADISMVKAFIQGRKQAVILYLYICISFHENLIDISE